MDSPNQLRIVSGGQTGVDRAALDAAMAAGIPCGGYCPLHRRADDGIIPLRYPLTETSSKEYPVRTRMNVEQSDGTLIITTGILDRGTRLTENICRHKLKPLLTIDLTSDYDIPRVTGWIKISGILVLNIAGPREMSSPGIYRAALAYLNLLFSYLKRGL
ncbi:MAG TPA: putative molybdenum carrier protein [Bacteroidales bacterium]|nr:putative molybdenum carrier protein [Bacteroidales bacterium]